MDTELQPAPPHENGSKIEESTSEPATSTADSLTNGNKDTLKDTVTNTPPKAAGNRKARSRSRTPQKKQKEHKKEEEVSKSSLTVIEENVNGHEVSTLSSEASSNGQEDANTKTEEPEAGKSESKTTRPTRKSTRIATKEQSELSEADNKSAESMESEPLSSDSGKTVEPVEMDSLILTDEPDPELQFDENSDMESVKGSPIQSRCKTRRSHSRHIPTPKTPKSATDSESEKNSVAPTPTPENLTETGDSLALADVSTRAETGSDTTRLDALSNELADDSYLNYTRERTLGETLRGLSARKTIRPINDSYRQRAFKNSVNKSDLNSPYLGHDLVDRISGLKRKRSQTPEERKKYKTETGYNFTSYLTSPLTIIKNKFSSDGSTPKLTGYKDGTNEIHGEGTYSDVISEEPDKKNRCAIM